MVNMPTSAAAVLADARQGKAPRWSRAVACVCFEITGPPVIAGPWRPGPLPVALPDGRHADRQARASYFQARAADSLYGSQGGASHVRWHRQSDRARIEEGSVLGIELVRFPHYTAQTEAGTGPASVANDASRSLCVLHLALDLDDPLAGLAAAVRLNPNHPGNVFWRETSPAMATRTSSLSNSTPRTAPAPVHPVIADLEAFRQQVEAQALEASVQVQVREEKRSRSFEHAASVAVVTVTLPALVFTALALPIQGVTAEGTTCPAG
jgi:hypothetical protein